MPIDKAKVQSWINFEINQSAVEIVSLILD